MANIYLRLPSVVCSFHRYRDPEHTLRPDEPCKYSRSSEHALILQTGLVCRTGNSSNKSPRCYSQTEWEKLVNGISPSGKNVHINRDPSVWPTYDEICEIEGRKLSDRSIHHDFLCIQIPLTVTLNGRVTRTNSNYSLNDKDAERLRALLVMEFNHALQEFERDNYDFCHTPDADGNIIQRSLPNILERFLLSYDIPVSKSAQEREALLRQMKRWKQVARKVLAKNYNFDVTYIDSADKLVEAPTIT